MITANSAHPRCGLFLDEQESLLTMIAAPDGEGDSNLSLHRDEERGLVADQLDSEGEAIQDQIR